MDRARWVIGGIVTTTVLLGSSVYALSSASEPGAKAASSAPSTAVSPVAGGSPRAEADLTCPGPRMGTNIDYASDTFDKHDLPRTFVGAFKQYRSEQKRPTAALRDSERFEREVRTRFGESEDVLVGRRADGSLAVVVAFTRGAHGGYLVAALEECD